MNRTLLTYGFGFAVALLSSVVSIEAAFAAPRSGYPCKNCLFQAPPEGKTKSPLLVVLHGDAPGGKAPLVARDSAPFFAAASERGIAVLAPMCPKDEGCLVGSFWQWSKGDPPAWISAQIDAVQKDFDIDPERIWIAGWSGGASFLGYHFARLGERYAAVIFVGGGIPPASSDCSSCSPPAYFLVGDKNPLHHLARRLKDEVSTCSRDVTWDLLPGKDHAGEWRAFSAPGQAAKLIDWLEKHPRNCPAPAAPAELPVATPAISASAAPVVQTPPLRDDPRPVATPAPGAHCGCRMVESSAWTVEAMIGGLGVSMALASRRFSRRAAATNQKEKAPKKVC